jgi:hypothetical protein
MARLAKKKKKVTEIESFVTIVGDLVIDPVDGFELPDDVAKTVNISFGNPGNTIILLDFIDDENRVIKQRLTISRSGLTMGVPEIWIDEIKTQLFEQAGMRFTTPFHLLKTGSNNGLSISHYSPQDLLILQNKIQSSLFLKSTLAGLLSTDPEFIPVTNYA